MIRFPNQRVIIAAKYKKKKTYERKSVLGVGYWVLGLKLNLKEERKILFFCLRHTRLHCV